MNQSLRLHPKHGVNPTMPVCFWCGKDRGDIALLGAAYKDEAPRSMFLDYEPCDKCKADMALGFTLIEATANQPKKNLPPIQRYPDTYPTGRWWVISREVAVQLFQNVDLSKGKAFIDSTVVKALELDKE